MNTGCPFNNALQDCGTIVAGHSCKAPTRVGVDHPWMHITTLQIQMHRYVYMAHINKLLIAAEAVNKVYSVFFFAMPQNNSRFYATHRYGNIVLNNDQILKKNDNSNYN